MDLVKLFRDSQNDQKTAATLQGVTFARAVSKKKKKKRKEKKKRKRKKEKNGSINYICFFQITKNVASSPKEEISLGQISQNLVTCA